MLVWSGFSSQRRLGGSGHRNGFYMRPVERAGDGVRPPACAFEAKVQAAIQGCGALHRIAAAHRLQLAIRQVKDSVLQTDGPSEIGERHGNATVVERDMPQRTAGPAEYGRAISGGAERSGSEA